MNKQLDVDHKTYYPLTDLYIYLTNNCNLSCSHCWISPDFSRDRQEGISPESLKKVILEAKTIGLQSVKLTGGEPLLYLHVQELLEFLSSEEISIYIETNGTMVDRDMVDIFSSADIDQISISLDAAVENIHDDLRGVKGSFNRIKEGLGLLSDAGFYLQVIMTLQKKNMHEIPALIRLCKDMGVNSLKINPMIPCGRAFNIFKQDRHLTLEELIMLQRIVKAESSCSNGLDIFFDLPSSFFSIEDLKSMNTSECHIFNILGILSNGDLSICGIGEAYPQLRMGSVYKDSISHVWENSAVLKELRRSLPKKLEGICGRCLFRLNCLGACRANAFALSHDLYAPYFLCQELFEKGLFPASRYIERAD